MECKVHKTEETDKETKKIPTKRKAKEALFKDTQLEKCIFTNNTLVKKVYSKYMLLFVCFFQIQTDYITIFLGFL